MNRVRSRALVDRPVRRLTALIVACILLATTGSDAFGLHRCPHHGALPGSTAESAVAGHEAGGHHATPPAAAHGAQDQAETEGHACTCVGTCSASASIAFTGVSGATQVIAPPTSHDDRSVPSTTPARVLPRTHVLPFATAPPLL